MADKTKTIKSATDKELDELLVRLRKENEVQNLIGDLKRKSSPYDSMSYDRPNVSTEEPIDSLYHVGVLGMKWGRRKGSKTNNSKKTKTEFSDDYKQSRQSKSKSYKSLSNKELQALTQRMELERKLRDLKSSDYQKGLDVVKTITAAGTTIASLYALSTTPLGQAVKKAITNRGNPYQMKMF